MNPIHRDVARSARIHASKITSALLNRSAACPFPFQFPVLEGSMMRTTKFTRAAVVALVAAGMLTPHSFALAGNSPTGGGFSAPAVNTPAAVKPVAPAADAGQTADVALVQGELRGRLVNGQGLPLEGAMVDIATADGSIAQTNTDAQGQFAVKGLKGGVYRITAGNETRAVRVWTERTAPPAAKPGLTMVSQAPAVRGQFGGVTPGMVLLTSGVIASVVLGAVAVSQNNDIENQNDQILDQLNQIPKTP
jgi:hypothetical protein